MVLGGVVGSYFGEMGVDVCRGSFPLGDVLWRTCGLAAGTLILVKLNVSDDLFCPGGTLTSSCLADGGRMAAAIRRAGGVANGIAGATNRPVVNTAMLRGKGAAGNAVASVSKGFAVGLPTGTALDVSCVKCVARRVRIKCRASFGMMLGSSAGALSRVVIMKCNSRGGTGLANTISSIGVSRTLKSHPLLGTTSTLRKTIPKLFISGNNGTPKADGSFRVHKTCSLNIGGSSKACKGAVGPLMLVSGIRKSVSVVGPRSVRSVGILGSTTSTTVCNTHTTKNIVLIAAGHPGNTSEFRLGCGGGFTFNGTIGLPGRTPLVSCLRTCLSYKCSSTC